MRAEGGRGLFTFVRVGLFYYTFLTIVCAICEAHKTVAKLSKMLLILEEIVVTKKNPTKFFN